MNSAYTDNNDSNVIQTMLYILFQLSALPMITYFYMAFSTLLRKDIYMYLSILMFFSFLLTFLQ